MDERQNELLFTEAMPALAGALRGRREKVLARWNELVRETLPEADELTMTQVRNSIPRVLDQMAAALEVAHPEPTRVLLEVTRSHGEVRFHENYNIRELIIEYRLLRRVLFEEVDAALAGRAVGVGVREWMALDAALDIALQQAVIGFIEHQKKQLKSATEAEAKFLSFLAHDMRNGLNSILLTMQWVESSLGRYPDLAEEAEGLRTAREDATRTIDSMERLLQAERLRKGVQVKRERVRLRGVVERVMTEVRRGVPGGKAVTLENRVGEEHEVTTDEGLLAVILQNLLGNAVKYSERGTVGVEAEHRVEQGVDSWWVSVSDQGPGIAPERVETLFNAFTRGETHGQPGVGLGLFISSQAARLLGTKLEVASTVGAGTRFGLVLRNLPAVDAV
jgi:signal transduction histidine kinase